MNKKVMNKRLMAVATASVLTVTMTCAPVFAGTGSNSQVVKEETVYVITDSKGKETEKIVSDHLVNDKDYTVITDKSNLSDIENVKGDEKYTTEGDSIKWDANGKDIYYQGNTSKNAPIGMSVKYYLDGKEISGSKLQGKSGKVTIKLNYTNSAVSNGVKVPFVVMTGMMTDNETFKNITIDNGKIIDSGNSSIIVGMSVPGLKDTLGISGKIKLGDSVTIKGDAKNFDCKDMMTIATSSFFEDIDTGSIDDLNFDDEINELDKAGKKLVQGSQQLYDGINYMNSNADKLTSGISDLVSELGQRLAEICTNLNKISSGASDVQKGLEDINVKITNGGDLKVALEAAKDYNQKAAANAKEGSEKAATAAGSAQESAKNADEALTKTNSVKSDIEKVKNTLNDINTEGMNEDQKKAIDDALALLEGVSAGTDGIIGSVNSAKEKAAGAAKVAGNAATAAGTASAQAGGAEQYTSGAEKGLGKISAGIGNANTKKTLIYGTTSIKMGADQMAGEIKESTTTGDLANGLNSLTQGAGQFKNGLNKLDAGSKKLRDGMSEYYSEGIKQIVDLYNDELKGDLDNFKSVINAGKDYNIFSQKQGNMDSNVKFIYKTRISE